MSYYHSVLSCPIVPYYCAVLPVAVITVGGTIDVMQYTVKEGDPLKVACITKKAVPPPSYSWVLANAIDDRYPLPLILNKRVNIDNDGQYTGEDAGFLKGRLQLIRSPRKGDGGESRGIQLWAQY